MAAFKINSKMIILSLIGLTTAVFNGYYLWVLKPPINTIEDALIHTGAFLCFIVSMLLVFGSYSLITFLESTDKHKYRKLPVQSLFFAMGFAMFSIVGLILLIFGIYSTFPEWTFPFWNIFFDIAPFLVIAYLVYHIIRFCLVSSYEMQKDGSVKQTLRRLWNERKEKRNHMKK